MEAKGLLGLVAFSEKRRDILLMLQKEPKTLKEIKDYFKVTSPEIIPQIRKLEKNNLIYQEDKKYFLTEIGEIITASFDRLLITLKIFENDMEFWKEHVICIPEEFSLRLYELGDYVITKSSPTEIFKPHDEYVKNLLMSKWIRGVSPALHPEYPTVVTMLAEKGLSPRAREVRFYKKKGYRRWAKEKEYGKRWVCTEGIFSAVKRIFGENVRSHKIRNSYKEAKIKFWAYQQIKNIQ